MIWAGFALLAVMALMPFVLAARGRAEVTRMDARDAWREQKATIEREHRLGRLTEKEYEQSLVELDRRTLAAADEDGQMTGPTAAGGTPVLVAALAALVILGAGGLYAHLGNPGVPESPAPRKEAAPGSEDARILDLLPQIEARLANNPQDAEGWRVLGQAYMAMGLYEKAADVFRRASLALPGVADFRIAQGEALVNHADGLVTPAARLAFVRANEIAPGHPAVRYYAGLRQFQNGDPQAALDVWKELAAISGPDAPWGENLDRQIARAEAALGGGVLSESGVPEITADDMAVVARMSPTEQRAFLEGMILNLRGRLEDNPGDLTGWLRLARVEEVMGRPLRAIDALIRAERLAEGEQQQTIRNRIEALKTAVDNG